MIETYIVTHFKLPLTICHTTDAIHSILCFFFVGFLLILYFVSTKISKMKKRKKTQKYIKTTKKKSNQNSVCVLVYCTMCVRIFFFIRCGACEPKPKSRTNFLTQKQNKRKTKTTTTTTCFNFKSSGFKLHKMCCITVTMKEAHGTSGTIYVCALHCIALH